MKTFRNVYFYLLVFLVVFIFVRPSHSEEMSLERANALSKQVIKLYNQNKYAEAIPLAEMVLAINEKTLGNWRPEVAESLNYLGVLYKSLGNYTKAEYFYKRALEINLASLDADHSRVGLIQNNLANLYNVLEDYSKAEPLYRQAIETFEKNLGADHPRLAKTFNNLGRLYYSLGDYAKAESSLKRALVIARTAFGADHPVVDSIMNDLAGLYKTLEDYTQADQVFREESKTGEPAPYKTGPKKTSSDAVDKKSKQPPIKSFAMDKSEPEIEARKPQFEGEDAAKFNQKIAALKPQTDRGDAAKISKEIETAQPQIEGGDTVKISNEIKAPQPQLEKEDELKINQEVEALQPQFNGRAEVIINKKISSLQPQFNKKDEAKITKDEYIEKKLSHPYTLHLDSFRTLKLTEKAMAIYRKKGLSPYWTRVDLKDKGIWYRVFAGYFAHSADAERFRQENGLIEATGKKTQYANLISIHTFRDELEAETKKLKEQGYSPYHIEYPDGKILLYVGSFITKRGAAEQYRELQSKGIENRITAR